MNITLEDISDMEFEHIIVSNSKKRLVFVANTTKPRNNFIVQEKRKGKFVIFGYYADIEMAIRSFNEL